MSDQLKAAESITVVIDGANHEIIMSYGLLQALTRVVQAAENIGAVATDVDLREKVLIELLSKRDDLGKITETFNAFKRKVSLSDADKLIIWAGEHTLDFFLRGLGTAKKLGEKVEAAMKVLMPSSNGTPA